VLCTLPGLFGMIWDALLAGMAGIFDNKMLFLAIVTGIVGILPVIKRLFSKSGADAGGGFFDGFKKRAIGIGDFMRGTMAAAGREVLREQKALQKQLLQINQQRRVLGAGNIGFGNRPLTDAMIKQAQKDLTALQSGYSKAQLAGMKFRYTVLQQIESFKKLSAASGTVVKGIGTIVKAFGQAATAALPAGRAASTGFIQTLKNGLSVGFTQVQMGFRQFWAGLKTIAKKNGTSAGTVLGQGLASGLTAAVGGFKAGQAAGGSAGSTALAALTAGLGGLAVGGPVVGAVAAGMTLVGAAFADVDEDAQNLAQHIGELASNLGDDLVAAMEAGVLTLNGLRDAFDFGELLQSTNVIETTANAIRDSMSPELRESFKAFGLTIADDVIPAFEKGGQSATVFNNEFGKAMGETIASSQAFNDEFKNNNDAVGQNRVALKQWVGLISEGAYTVDTLRDRLKTTTGVTDEQRATLLNLLDTHKDFFLSVEGIRRSVSTEAIAIYQAAKAAQTNAVIMGDLENAAKGAAGEMHGLARSEGTVESGSRDLQTNLQTVADRLEILGKNSEQAKALIDKLFDFGGGDFQNSMDDAMIAVDGLGQRIADDLAEGSDIGAAKARESLRSLGTNLSDVIKAGVEEGTILNPVDARNLTKDIFDAATAGLDPGSEAYRKIAEQYNAALAGVQPVIDAYKATQEAAKFQMLVQQYLDLHPTATLAEAEVVIKNRQITAEVTAKLTVARVELSTKTGQSAERNPEAFAAGLFGKWNKGIEIPATVKVGMPAPADVKTDFVPIGKAADEGVKKGVRDNKQIVIAEMRRLALDAKQAAEVALGIRSPSKVFAEIGKNVMLGFVNGVNTTAQEASDAARATVNAAIDAAVNSMDAGKAAMTTAAQTLFAGLTGSDAAAVGGGGPLAAMTSLGAITTAVQSFQSQVASAAQTAWDTAMKKPSEMTAADLNLLGESYVSLNATDVLGTQNLASLTSVLDSIASYGETLIGQGRPVQEVIDIVNQQVDAFYDMAVGMGFNSTQLAALIDQLGLSGDALDAFMGQLADIGEAAGNAEPNRLPTVPVVDVPDTTTATTATATTTTASTEGRSMQMSRTQINNIELHLPYADPQAVALAVANRAATLV